MLGIEAGPAMVSSDLDLTYTIIWSLALANVLGAGSCMLLARPIARLTTIPFNLLAPFMIMVVSFAAFQATRQFMDLVALLAIGVLGVLLKRFGWSRPAFLIGFVLAPQAEGYLNLAVQFYGWGLLARPGVLIILAITTVSVWLGARGRTSEARVAAAGMEESSGGSRPSVRTPQLVFLGGAVSMLLYTIWSSLQLSPLGSMFPVSVAIVTLALCGVLIVTLTFGPPDSPANVDLEYDTDEASAGNPVWRNAGWFGVLVALTAFVGFLSGTLAFFAAFLTFKAKQTWRMTMMLTAAALVVLTALTNFLLVELPAGLLSLYVDLPWLLGQAR